MLLLSDDDCKLFLQKNEKKCKFDCLTRQLGVKKSMHIDRGSLCFSLFGIPIAISPFSWLILAVLGGALDMNDAGDLRDILLFVVVGMLTLIVHELGHALVGRSLGGEPHGIVIQGLGAATYSRPPAGKWPYFFMVLAGPLATLLPAFVAGVFFGLQVCGNPVEGIATAFTLPLGIIPPNRVLALMQENLTPFQMVLYMQTFVVSVWWCLFNLLPILPMDGGHLLATLCANRRIVCGVGMALSALFAIWALSNGYVFMLMLFAYFAYVNFRMMKSGF